MIDYEYPDIFLGTAVQKDLLITDGEVTVEDDEYTVTDETVLFETQDFETEAFELYQSVNSSEQITWGSCETGKVSFIVRKRYTNSIIGTKLKVYIMPNHDASKMLQLGVFKVAEDKQTDNYSRHSITAYDAMYDVLNANVTDWYDDILQDEESYCTLGDLWYTFLNQFGLESADGDNYFNDDLIIRRTIEKDRISGAEIIKAICELNGAFGVITNEGKFIFKGLRPDIFHSLDTYTLDVPQYMDISFEDTPFRPIKKVKVITDKGNATSTQAATGKYNTYTIAYNPLIADYSGAELQDLANGMCELLGNHSYVPCTITALGNPVMEVGDNMIVWTKYGYGIMTYIFERRLRGIQALRDTYTTSGSEYLTERLNDSASQYSQLSNEIAQATQAAIVAASTDFVEIIRNIGFRLLDEPSNVSVEYEDEPEPPTPREDIWVVKTWYGLTNPTSSYIWSDGTDIYYSRGTQHYILNRETDTWVSKTWNGLTNFDGSYIWSDGTNVYYSASRNEQYVLDKSTSTWNTKTWGTNIPMSGGNVWTDGTNVYYSNGQYQQYVLDKSTSTWNTKTWNGYSNLIGVYIWTDGENIYHSNNGENRVLDPATSTWSNKTWNGYTNISGEKIWYDRDNIYYSSYSAYQYVLDKTTSTWSVKTWDGFSNFPGTFIWKDGDNTYCSNDTNQFVLT